MQRNILELAKEETIAYLKEIKTSKTFKEITEKYIKLHNKGIFINFTFNSSDATGLFSSFSHFYDFPLETYVNPNFTRDKVLYLSDLEKKQRNKKNSLEKELEDLDKVERNFRTSSKELNLDISSVSLPEVIDQDFFNNTYANNDFLSFTSAIFTLREKNINKQLKRKSEEIDYVKKSQRNIRYIESQLREIEFEFFKVVLKKFFSMVEKYAANLFKGKKVAIKYSEKGWINYYKDRRNNKSNYYSNIKGLSNFESFMIDVIQNKIHNFKIKVFDNELVYNVSKTYTSTDTRMKIKDNTEEALTELYKQFNELKRQYPEFIVAVRLINQLAEKRNLNDPILANIYSFLRHNYSPELFESYDSLVKKIQEIEKKKYVPEPYIQLPTISESFSELSFDIRKEKDMAYWYGLKEERYNDIIASISNDDYVLYFMKEESETI